MVGFYSVANAQEKELLEINLSEQTTSYKTAAIPPIVKAKIKLSIPGLRLKSVWGFQHQGIKIKSDKAKGRHKRLAKIISLRKSFLMKYKINQKATKNKSPIRYSYIIID